MNISGRGTDAIEGDIEIDVSAALISMAGIQESDTMQLLRGIDVCLAPTSDQLAPTQHESNPILASHSPPNGYEEHPIAGSYASELLQAVNAPIPCHTKDKPLSGNGPFREFNAITDLALDITDLETIQERGELRLNAHASPNHLIPSPRPLPANDGVQVKSGKVANWRSFRCLVCNERQGRRSTIVRERERERERH